MRRGFARAADVALLGAIGIVLVAVVAAAARPAERTLDDRARALDAEIRCPVCQGTSIADSPADFAVDMREVVREQLATGATDDQVRGFFLDRYGTWILLAPPASGPEVVVWLAPAIILLGGAVALARRSRRRPGVTASLAVPAAPGRIGSAILVGAVVLAIAVPVALAVGPRQPGAEITGASAAESAERAGELPSIADLEAAAASRPADTRVLLALGDAYLAAERRVDAARVYRQVLATSPGNETASLRLGVILLSAGRPAEATELLDAVLARSPEQPDALLYRALSRYAAGAPPDTVRSDALAFLAVAVDDPRRPMAENLLDLASTKRSQQP